MKIEITISADDTTQVRVDNQYGDVAAASARPTTPITAQDGVVAAYDLWGYLDAVANFARHVASIGLEVSCPKCNQGSGMFCINLNSTKKIVPVGTPHVERISSVPFSDRPFITQALKVETHDGVQLWP